MDYLDGKTLEQVLKNEGYLDTDRALDIFIQTTEAIAHAHLKGVIHRDIKPSNIIIEQGEHKIEHIKVVDFGIAKVLPSEQQTQNALTQTGDIFGTPLYMSPEQCQGNMQDARSDIYALGCVMYEALTGITPFAAENPIKIILRHVNGDAKPMAAVNRSAGVPADLEAVVMRCLEVDPEDRYQKANELLLDLRRVRDAKPINIPPRRKKPPAKSQPAGISKIGAIAGVIGAIAGLIGVGAAVFALMHAPTTPIQQTDSLGDAQSFDQKSYQYFMSGQYRKALPLLQFGIPSYEEKLEQDRKAGNSNAVLQDQTWLAENWQHIGKCYLAIGKDAQKAGDTASAQDNFNKAREAYKQAMPFYYRYGNWNGGSTPEAVRDYAETLRLLNDQPELARLKEFADRWNLSM
jgi:serine/threonine protein kinase